MDKKTFGLEINNIVQQILIKRSDFQTLINQLNETIKERDLELNQLIEDVEYTNRNLNNTISKIETLIEEIKNKVEDYLDFTYLTDTLYPRLKAKFVEIYNKYFEIFNKHLILISEYLNNKLEESLYQTETSYTYNIYNNDKIREDEEYNTDDYKYNQPYGSFQWYSLAYKENNGTQNFNIIQHLEWSARKKPLDLIGNSGSAIYENLLYNPYKGMMFFRSTGWQQTANTRKFPEIGMMLDNKASITMGDYKDLITRDEKPSPNLGNIRYNNYVTYTNYSAANRAWNAHANPTSIIELPLCFLYRFESANAGSSDITIYKIRTLQGRESREPHLFVHHISRTQDNRIYTNGTAVNNEIRLDNAQKVRSDNYFTNPFYNLIIRPTFFSKDITNTPQKSINNLIVDNFDNLQKGTISSQTSNKRNTNSLLTDFQTIIKDEYFFSRAFVPTFSIMKYYRYLYTDKNNKVLNRISLDTYANNSCSDITRYNKWDANSRNRTLVEFEKRGAFEYKQHIGTLKRHKSLVKNNKKSSLFANWYPTIETAMLSAYDYIQKAYLSNNLFFETHGEFIGNMNFNVFKDLFTGKWKGENDMALEDSLGFPELSNFPAYRGDQFNQNYSTQRDTFWVNMIKCYIKNKRFPSGNDIGHYYYREDFFFDDHEYNHPNYQNNSYWWYSCFNWVANYTWIDYDWTTGTATPLPSATNFLTIYNWTVGRNGLQSYSRINNQNGRKIYVHHGSTANYVNNKYLVKKDIEDIKFDFIKYISESNDEPLGTIKYLPYQKDEDIHPVFKSLYAKAGSVLSKKEYPEAYAIFKDDYAEDAIETFNPKTHFAIPNFRDRYLIGEYSNNSILPKITNSLPSFKFEIEFNDSSNSDNDTYKQDSGIISKKRIDKSIDNSFSLGEKGNGATIVESIEVETKGYGKADINKGKDFRTDIWIKVRPINYDPYINPIYTFVPGTGGGSNR